MCNHDNDLLIAVSRACYDAQWEEGFDQLNPCGVEYAMALQVGRAATAMAVVLLADHKPRPDAPPLERP